MGGEKDATRTSAGKSGNSRTASGARERVNTTKKKKALDDIEEVYEELHGFIAHTKMAFISFFSLIFHIVKYSLGFVFFRILFPVLEKILWAIFLVLVFICTTLAFVGNLLEKLKDKNKRLNPFFNKKQMQRIDKFDKIWEKKKFTLVLDLDGTLIHASRQKKTKIKRGVQYDRLNMNVLGQGRQTVHLYTRPHLEDFLSKMGEIFNLVVFSASEECYCDVILDHIDKWRVIKQRFYKHSVEIEQKTIKKDLQKIFKHSLENVIMVEDAPGVCVQKDKSIILDRWDAENPKDADLKFLMDVLVEAVEHAETGADLISFYKKKQVEAAERKDLEVKEPEEDNQDVSLFVETEGGLTSPNYEETIQDDHTEMSRDDFSRQEMPMITINKPISKKDR